jgi:hypothetical protein
VPESSSKPRRRLRLFWSRYITTGSKSEEEFDLHRFFDDAEYVAIKVACFLALLIILFEVVSAHLK